MKVATVFPRSRRRSSSSFSRFLILCLVLAAAPTLAGPEWTASYTKPDDTIDSPRAMAVDDGGNALVTGASSGDFLTIRYDAAGTQVWTARFDGGMHDEPTAIALDHEGNVFVTGGSLSATSFDILTVKYGRDGKQAWAVRFDGPDGGDDAPAGIVLDGSGSAFVAGTSWDLEGTGSDYVVVKYDASGREIWTASWDGPDGLEDRASGVALDASGNIAVTGLSLDASGDLAIATMALDGIGKAVWTDRIPAWPAMSQLAGLEGWPAVAADAAGGVYITGTASDGDSCFQLTVLRDPAGVEVWSHTIAEPAPPIGGLMGAIALAPDGHVLVAVPGGPKSALLDYGPGGDLSWSKEIPSDSRGATACLALDADGAPRVAVPVEGGIAIQAFDRSGNVTWREVRPCALEPCPDIPFGIAVDPEGGVLVLASSTLPHANEDYLTSKYGPTGDLLWEARWNGAASGTFLPHSIVADGAGNSVILGSMATIRDGLSIAAVKHDASGRELWAVDYLHPSRATFAAGIAADAGGNVCMAATTGEGILTLKYGPDGELLWARAYASWTSPPSASAIAVDEGGGIRVTGTIASWEDSDIVIVSYSPDGNRLWERIYEGPIQGRDEVYAMTMDGQGSVVLAGSSEGIRHNLELGGLPFWDGLVLKYGSQGIDGWTRRWIGKHPFGGDASVADVAVDGQGNVLAAAVAYDPGDPTAASFASFILKYDPDGNLLWESNFPAPVGGSLKAIDIAVDDSGCAVAIGESITLLEAPARDARIVKLDPEGKVLWMAGCGDLGKLEVFPQSVAIDPDRKIFVTAEAVTLQGVSQVLLLKYGPTGTRLRTETYSGETDDATPLDLALDGLGNAFVAASGESAVIKFAMPPASFIRGDCDGNGRIEGVTDALTLLLHNFAGATEPPCVAACDSNGDGEARGQVTDAIHLLNHAFLGGPPPPAPFPECGPDPAEVLDCVRPPDC
jgi:hypothetical protein